MRDTFSRLARAYRGRRARINVKERNAALAALTMYEDGNPDGYGAIGGNARFQLSLERERQVQKLIADERSTPASLRKRPEDVQRWLTRESGSEATTRRWYNAILGIACTAFNLPNTGNDYAATLIQEEESFDQRRQCFIDNIGELELELNQQSSHEGIASTSAPSDETETPSTDTEAELQGQVHALREEKDELEGRLDFLRDHTVREWVGERLDATRHALTELKHGLRAPMSNENAASWRVLGLSGMYQHVWRLREARDALLQGNLLTDECLRNIMFSFLGLGHIHDNEIKEQAAMALFTTLAKAHRAAGSDTVPETYQAYYMICAQLFGPATAAALLHAPLTEEEVQSLQGADLTGVYDQGSMYRMAVEDRLAHLDQPIRSDSMTPEGMRELHVRRLRGPWGRLYVKEMAKLRQLLPSLDIALPDFNGERRAIEQRLGEVKYHLYNMEIELEYVLRTAPPASSLPGKADEREWWWRRVLRWLSRLRGSVANKLRKLRDRLWGKPEGPHKAKTGDTQTDDKHLQTLRESIQNARHQLRDLEKRGQYVRQVRELDDELVEGLKAAGLGKGGELCETIDSLAMAAWDLHDDSICLPRDPSESGASTLTCTLLRLCYVNVPSFFALLTRDANACQSLMKRGFIKGFKLRRKGHTDKVSNQGLSVEEMGLLTGLCAGMDAAQVWMGNQISEMGEKRRRD